MSDFYNNSIFWVEVDRISPNPYQPRKAFDDGKIAELADSIRQYGVLQPLVVTRKETEREDGGISVEYELIAGERRLRAAKLANIPQVPVIIRAKEETDKMKLELAIIENLQREDLNAIDRAKAFKRLVDEFNLKHSEVAKKIGKSREYVSNTLRLLALPENIQQAIVSGEISEGHARPLLMLGDDRSLERDALFEEIKAKKLTVRESERIARRIATEKTRKQDLPPELLKIEKNLTETLGTRVQIERRSDKGGKVHIDYFSEEDLRRLLELLNRNGNVVTDRSVDSGEEERNNSVTPGVSSQDNIENGIGILNEGDNDESIDDDMVAEFERSFAMSQNISEGDKHDDTYDDNDKIDSEAHDKDLSMADDFAKDYEFDIADYDIEGENVDEKNKNKSAVHGADNLSQRRPFEEFELGEDINKNKHISDNPIEDYEFDIADYEIENVDGATDATERNLSDYEFDIVDDDKPIAEKPDTNRKRLDDDITIEEDDDIFADLPPLPKLPDFVTENKRQLADDAKSAIATSDKADTHNNLSNDRAKPGKSLNGQIHNPFL